MIAQGRTKTMKKRIYLLLVISAILSGCTQRSGNRSIAEVPLVLTGDSGYFTKSQALPYLLAKGLTDTSGAYWHNNNINQSDTIGKYFRANQPGHYIALFRIFDRQDLQKG